MAMAVVTSGAAIQGAEIHRAAELGDLQKVKARILEDPKQINSTDAKGRTVLACAFLGGKKELVDFLLEKGAAEDISAAAITGHTDKVAEFVKQDPKLLNATDSGGKAPLHWAALYGQAKVVELLLAQKADVNLLDEVGFTALHWAAMFDKSDVVGALLANKANFKLRVAKFGWTPLRLAVLHGHVATADALLKGGADPNATEDGSIPLLHQAILSGKKEMVELLLAHNADVNRKDSEGETPLAEALEGDKKDIAKILREHGAKEK